MCDVCGLWRCDYRCPNYVPQNDVKFVRFCEQCGEPVWNADENVCEWCKEEQNGINENG